MNARTAVQLMGREIIRRTFFYHCDWARAEMVNPVVITALAPDPERPAIVALAEDVEDGQTIEIDEQDKLTAAIWKPELQKWIR